MKHFLVEITYTGSMEQVDAVLPAHREYLMKGYNAGLLLMSGPQNPRTGGIVIARAESLEELKAYFAQDPYAVENVGGHRFVEFNPARHQGFLSDWVAGN